jgi:hypothetical protein
VVYGSDDRRDVYDHPDPRLRALAERSVVALVRPAMFDRSEPPAVGFNAYTLQEDYHLCSDQRFLNDPSVAGCSGTLIDDDLVLTAGHCVADAQDCANWRFVFGFYNTAAGTLHPLTEQDVFSCSALVARARDDGGSTEVDYAVVRLDRRATPRFAPAALRGAAAPVETGQPLAVIGFGSGIPAKIDSGGTVRDPRAGTLDYFVATTDTFGGSSGSGVFDLASQVLLGLLTRGEADYVSRGGCQVVNVCPRDGCSGEHVVYAHGPAVALCRATSSARLCGSRARCGDGRCETVAESPQSCPDDCRVAPPAGWTCAPEVYADRDECDCACGLPDPDCDDPSLAVHGCPSGEVCGPGGECAPFDPKEDPIWSTGGDSAGHPGRADPDPEHAREGGSAPAAVAQQKRYPAGCACVLPSQDEGDARRSVALVSAAAALWVLGASGRRRGRVARCARGGRPGTKESYEPCGEHGAKSVHAVPHGLSPCDTLYRPSRGCRSGPCGDAWRAAKPQAFPHDRSSSGIWACTTAT